MSRDPNLPNRKNIRLKGYDYSNAGLYFLTICVQDRECLFGHVMNGEMTMNDAGTMVEKWYWELENKYPDKICHNMVVMPNHFHCIIENKSEGFENIPLSITGNAVDNNPTEESRYGMHNKQYGASIFAVMDWFKTMTTNEYIRGVKQSGWTRYNNRLWQRKYYDVIIRTPESYNRIAGYINDNPSKWKEDMFHL